MTPETGREAECWIKLSLLTVLSVPEILRLLQQTGGVEALFDASSGTLTKLAGETAAREIREVNPEFADLFYAYGVLDSGRFIGESSHLVGLGSNQASFYLRA